LNLQVNNKAGKPAFVFDENSRTFEMLRFIEIYNKGHDVTTLLQQTWIFYVRILHLLIALDYC